jgi:predicted AAA+ superfamily ATPase
MADFTDIVANQKEDLEELLAQRIIDRRPMSRMEMNAPFAQVAIGVRRSGKSVVCRTALSRLGEPFGYVNFDDEKLDGIEASDLDDVLKAVLVVYGPVKRLFFDEIQDVPSWPLFVNRLLRKGFHIVISGSNARLLSSDLATHLTGRHVATEIFPFSFAEYRKYLGRSDPRTTTERAEARRDYDRYLRFGGLPETFGLQDPRGYLRSLFDSILFRDIFRRHNLRNPKMFSDVAKLVMESYGREISPTRIASRLGIRSSHTVDNYIRYMEAAYLVQSIYRFSQKTAERLRIGKVYSIDLGFASYFTGVSEWDESRGRRLENAVFLVLRAAREEDDAEIAYYRDQSHEVDFVVVRLGKAIRLIQVSHSLDNPATRKRELSALFAVGEKLKCDNLLLITDHEDGIETDGRRTVKIVNVVDWLLEEGRARE